MSGTDDKRRHPRVAHRIRVRSTHHDEPAREALELETIDLSAGGLNCTAPVFLPPMTKLALSLVLPAGPSPEAHQEQRVSGEAVVVRSDPSHPKANGGTYRVALFFSKMDDADRHRLHEFVKSRAGRPGSH